MSIARSLGIAALLMVACAAPSPPPPLAYRTQITPAASLVAPPEVTPTGVVAPTVSAVTASSAAVADADDDGPDDKDDNDDGADPSRTAGLRGPTGNAGIPGASVSGAAIANASAVVAGMFAGFRRCFQRALVKQPGLKVTVRIRVEVGPQGEIVSSAVEEKDPQRHTPPALRRCLLRRVNRAQFASPEGGGRATVVIPVLLFAEPFHRGVKGPV